MFHLILENIKGKEILQNELGKSYQIIYKKYENKKDKEEGCINKIEYLNKILKN